MKTAHMDGKTEPASQATGWSFIVGSFVGTDQLRNAVNQLQSQLYTA